ncbi:MAG: TetR/AcrR family transcriptional regulator [Treponema sp.]|nr:TetR/AcrR family transcriptional regulator [Treponema sp.]
MSRRNLSQEKIVQSFLTSAFEKSAGATSLTDIADDLEIKKASLYNHFESRDSIYTAAVDFCAKEMGNISFMADKTLDSIKNGKTNPLPLFRKLITRFFELYESEPLFQIYTFVHTEQYFNLAALKIIRDEEEKISDEIRRITLAFIDAGKIPPHPEKSIKEASLGIASIIFAQRDFYIANRKETVRQNPECGAGSLFALPTNDEAVSKTIKAVEEFIKVFIQ